MHERVLGEAVDEEADGQEHGTAHGSIEPRFGRSRLVRVRVGNRAVFSDLEGIKCEAERGADAEGNVRQSADAFAPVALLLEGDSDDREEEEGDEPRETDPQSEEEDHRLRDHHDERLDGRIVKHLLQRWRFQVRPCHVPVVSGDLAQLVRSFAERHGASSLGQTQYDHDRERYVRQALYTLDPSPTNGLIDKSSIYWCPNRTEDGHVRKCCHGPSPLLRYVPIVGYGLEHYMYSRVMRRNGGKP